MTGTAKPAVPFWVRPLLTVWNGYNALRGKPRRVSRKHCRVIARLTGDDFAQAAQLAGSYYGGTAPKVRFNAADQTYVVEDTQKHVITHPRIISYFLLGTQQRGASLGQEYLIEHVPFQDGDHIVEVGANIGDLALALEGVGHHVHLTSFEPSPREFAALSENLKHKPWLMSAKAHQKALWDDDSLELDFYVKSATADNSVLPILDYDEVIKVKSARLDAMLEPKPYRFLKLEAEGAEPEVLKGAQGVLHLFEYIAADVGPERGVSQDSTEAEVTEILTKHGFEVTARHPRRDVVLFHNTKFNQEQAA